MPNFQAMAFFKTPKLNISTTMKILKRDLYGKFTADMEIKKSYNVLGIPEGSDQEEIRAAYLKLVKRFHPDSGNKEADSNKFKEIDRAFRFLLNQNSKERWIGKEETYVDQVPIEFDIKHTAPQHRQYLSYNGIGYGTPSQREKQYIKSKAVHAAENIMNHRINKAAAEDNAMMEKKTQKHTIKTKYGFDRLVEDLIQESMAKGEFDNLSGKGKPLQNHHHSNPYVDFVTHKLNQVLIDNGFTPEWIMLQKEIRIEKQQLRDSLNQDRRQLGNYPWDDFDKYKWAKILDKHNKLVMQLNKKIEKFNLVVPVLQKQMLLVLLDKIADNIAKEGMTKHLVRYQELKNNEAKENPQNLMSFFESFFLSKRKPD